MITRFEYKQINLSLEPVRTFEAAANRWGAMGWRTVGIVPSQGPGYADVLLIEREITIADPMIIKRGGLTDE